MKRIYSLCVALLPILATSCSLFTGGESGDNSNSTTATTIYYENFDGDPSYTNWANQGTSWQNPMGEGAYEVTYDAYYAKLYNDLNSSMGQYVNASGKCYMNIYAPTQTTCYVEINNISTGSAKQFTLLFGAAFQASQCNLYVKGDDSDWQRLEYSASSAYKSWALAMAPFTIVGDIEKLSFRFEPTDTNAQLGCWIDDLHLLTSSGGQIVEFAPKTIYQWAELPNKNNSKSDYVYHTHWSTSVSSKQKVRNYSYCYDVRRHSPMWIAHPQHTVYQEGGKTRPDEDPWACDPYLTDSQSAVVYPVNGYICSLRTYSSEFEFGYYQWQRGHMIPSSYRGCGDKSNPAEINVQTFYSSNIAAQRKDANSAFQILWGAAEKKIQDSYVCPDTLYVVSGAHFANENTKALDGNMYDLPNICKTCVVPTHFYKIVLRTRRGNTGKKIQDCSASELKAVGFWFSNTDVDEQTGLATPTLSSAHLHSVAEIERLTGNEFNFFPEIPNEVKQSFNTSDWGF